MGKEKKISREDIAKMSREERMKYEIAQELGLLDQVLEEGWKTLSAKETGRIGGIMNRRRKQKEKEGGISQRKSSKSLMPEISKERVAMWRQMNPVGRDRIDSFWRAACRRIESVVIK